MFSRFNSGLFAALIIGILIISFMFSGFDAARRGSPTDAAKVGPYTVSIRDYQNEYNRQIQFFTQLSGGQSLTTKQIEQFSIKKNSMTSLLNQKMMLIFGDQLGVTAGEDEVRDEIKNMPYFKVNNEFDVTTYKNAIGRVNMTPAEFENEIAQQIKFRKTQQFLQSMPTSKSYKDDLKRFNDQKITVNIVQFQPSLLQKFIEITSDELDKFLSAPQNIDKLKAVFNERRPQLDQPEKIKVRHILFLANEKNLDEVKGRIEELAKKVTPNNFAQIANEKSEDPETKIKGGDLGTITKGMMVPEFDQVAFSIAPETVSPPIKTEYGYHLILVDAKLPAFEAKFDDFKNKLATELLQRQKIDQEKKLASELTDKLKKVLAQNDRVELKKLYEKYQFSQYLDKTINRLSGLQQVQIKEDDMDKLFKSTPPQVFVFYDLNHINVVSLLNPSAKDAIVKDNEKDKAINPEANDNESGNRSMYLAQKLREDILQNLQKEFKTKIYINLQEME